MDGFRGISTIPDGATRNGIDSHAGVKGEARKMRIRSILLPVVVFVVVLDCGSRASAQVFSAEDLREIEDVRTNGVGARFVVPLLDVAAKSGRRTTFIIHAAAVFPVEVPSGGKRNPVYLCTENDLRTWKMDCGEPKKIGDGSVLAFSGDDIPIRDWTFHGPKDYPFLTFLVMKGKGLVWLRGSGKVRSPDGTTTDLPPIR
jgi:hypothetical protein